ncbi:MULTISPECIES: caspase family protein [unclassified Leptolyngbya]|uniref:caspase family protein n=1 Tax=unclassified Leptolyngbya TaxID=2650499 RepID=UPI0016829770|nr:MULTISPECIES: caspase family protein [unclassified Leptolyngbya]MBD1911871.1 caspase family protein [Leptolyngbya sp. FACHB-8]MBD2156080.1 caspase family protein [Leptolyngbya sp. FACHB-16]
MALTRRAFLQRTGWAIATLGLSQSSFFALGDRYQQALAEPTRRQRALLIGINQYPESVCDFAPIKGTALAGCITDVELQRELLIHRFGFAATDILTLTDEAATRRSIEDAFQAHLMAAQPNERVLFHFSGLGSQVRSLETNLTFQTLVPIDGTLPTEDHPTFNDVRLATLRALLRSLPTQQVTTVIDAAFLQRSTPLQGNFRVRSRPSTPSGRLNPAEQELQEQLAKAATKTINQTIPGLYLGAAETGQPALEGQWSGFSAGLLTYALTQYLWEATPPKTIQIFFPSLVSRIHQTVDNLQTPVLEAGSSVESIYSLPPALPESQGAVWEQGTDGSVEVWLGGVPPRVLECYGEGSVLLAGSGEQAVPLVGRSRTGLLLKADVLDPTPINTPELVGQPVRESMRLISRNLGLTIALDPSLERIERVDATSAFAAAKVTVVAAGEQTADLLFGKVKATTLTASSDISATPALPKSYGLFYPPRLAVPGTIATADEAVKTAVTRLTAKLPRLLAMKYLSLTENATTSRLALRATLEPTETNSQAIAQLSTPSAASDRPPSLGLALPTVASGTALQCRVQNLGQVPLYLLWVTLPQMNRPLSIALLPDTVADAPMVAIAPGTSRSLPITPLNSGLVDLFLIASRNPFPQTTALIQSQQETEGNNTAVQTSLSRVQAILQDLSSPRSPEDAYALDVNRWATLRLQYRVI